MRTLCTYSLPGVIMSRLSYSALMLRGVLYMCTITVLETISNTHHLDSLSSKKHRLEELLMKNYNPNVDRPIRFERVTLVYLDLYLYQILELNSKQQYLEVSVWMTQSWEDDYLFWDPSEHNGTSLLHIPSSLIWKPDTYLLNKVGSFTDHSMIAVLHPVVSTGQPGSYNTTWVTLGQPAIYKISCHMNMIYFPWDTQICTLNFSSWSYLVNEIDYDFLITKQDSTEHYISNQEFDLIEQDAQRKIAVMDRTYPVHGVVSTQYTVMEFMIKIRRKALYYIVNLVIPSFILTVISILGFFSPSSSTGERTEKISLGIAAISALFMILLVIGDQMSTTSVVIPLIGYYFLALMLLTFFALLGTRVILHLHKEAMAGQPAPQWLMWIESTFSNKKNCLFNRKKNLCKRRPNKNKDGNNISLKGLNNDPVNPLPTGGREVLEELEIGDSEQQCDIHCGQGSRSDWERSIGFLETMLCILFLLLAFVVTSILFIIGFVFAD